MKSKTKITEDPESGFKLGHIYYLPYGVNSCRYAFYQIVEFTGRKNLLLSRIVRPQSETSYKAGDTAWSYRVKIVEGRYYPSWCGESLTKHEIRNNHIRVKDFNTVLESKHEARDKMIFNEYDYNLPKKETLSKKEVLEETYKRFKRI